MLSVQTVRSFVEMEKKSNWDKIDFRAYSMQWNGLLKMPHCLRVHPEIDIHIDDTFENNFEIEKDFT